MTFFVDANVIVYSTTASSYQAPCLEILEAVARGTAAGRTSTAVLEEVWHLELSGRVGPLTGLTRNACTILSPLLEVSEAIFHAALVLPVSTLGANDRVHAATCLEAGIDTILSADPGFDTVAQLRRVDPLDTSGRRELIG